MVTVLTPALGLPLTQAPLPRRRRRVGAGPLERLLPAMPDLASPGPLPENRARFEQYGQGVQK